MGRGQRGLFPGGYRVGPAVAGLLGRGAGGAGGLRRGFGGAAGSTLVGRFGGAGVVLLEQQRTQSTGLAGHRPFVGARVTTGGVGRGIVGRRIAVAAVVGQIVEIDGVALGVGDGDVLAVAADVEGAEIRAEVGDHGPETQFGRLLESAQRLFLVLHHSGQGDHDVVPLPGDLRLGDTDFVDTTPKEFDGEVQGLVGDVPAVGAGRFQDHRHPALEIETEQGLVAGDDGVGDSENGGDHHRQCGDFRSS